MFDITSGANRKCKYVRSLSRKKEREDNGEYTVEGAKSVSDALNSDREVTALYISVSFYESEVFDYPESIPLYRVTDEVFEKMSDTKAPQGILAVIKIKDDAFEPVKEKAYIYCDGISDPGNLGTIIRTADAAGFGGVMLSPSCADMYNPKTVRASMGSFFNMSVMRGVTHERLFKFAEKGFSLVGGALAADSADYRSADMTKPVIIVVGNEANGISGEILDRCVKVKIPILGSAESLNAAVAAGILMYEAVRQRGIKHS